jgi:PAS domain S-box-containing protein
MDDLYSRLLKFTKDGIYRYTFDDGVIIFANQGIADILECGMTPEELVGKRLSEVMVYTQKSGIIRRLLEKHNEIHNFEYHFKTLAGKDKWVLHDSFILKGPNGKPIAEAIVKDITERKTDEIKLFEEKERLRITLSSIGDAVIATDTNGIITLINSVAQSLTGYGHDEAIGRPLKEVFHIINQNSRLLCENPVEKVLKSGTVIGLANHTALITRNHDERIIADSGAPIRDREGNIIGVILVFRDVTEQHNMEAALHEHERKDKIELESMVAERTRSLEETNALLQDEIRERLKTENELRKKEEEIIRASKLESLGTLAGGIAHDFNNVLAGILGNIHLAKKLASPEEKLYDILIRAENVAFKARNLTEQLITFSRGGEPIKNLMQINDLVREAAKFALSGSNITCKFDLDENLRCAEIDEGQIMQVVTNLVINAKQAMPEGGDVGIRTLNVQLDEPNDLPLAPGEYIRISVTDGGQGIASDIIERIFDPYFSTRPGGSGLGLSTSYSIIKNHNGHINAESKAGSGSSFFIYLPASAAKPSAAEPIDDKKLIIKNKNILIMDDDETVLMPLYELLTSMGCSVKVSRNGGEAVDLYKEYRQSGRPFDVIIMDLVVKGGIGGREALEKIIKIDPGVRAIASSGYSNDPVLSDYSKYGFSAVLPKPYQDAELYKTLHRVMNGN